MHYLIDGYNLMFRVEQAEEDLQVQRERLIRRLDEKFIKSHIKGIIIFDAHLQQGEGAIEYAKNLDIYYTAYSQTADEAILELLNGLKASGWIIVTSDKGLAQKVRRTGFTTETVEQFLSSLKKKGSKKAPRREIYSAPIIPPKPKTKLPTLQTHPDECFDYYLEMFQREIEPEKPKKGTRRKLAPKKKEEKEEKGLSDFERWFKAFQQEDLPS